MEKGLPVTFPPKSESGITSQSGVVEADAASVIACTLGVLHKLPWST